MKDFKQGGRFGGNSGGGYQKRDFNKGGFGGGGRGGGSRDFGGRPEMHSAICASCGKTCEVPFRPNGEKPVYCRDCFNNPDREHAPSQSFARRDSREERPSYRPEASHAAPQRSGSEDKIQLDLIIKKLDKLISLFESSKTAPEAFSDKTETLKQIVTEAQKSPKKDKKK